MKTIQRIGILFLLLVFLFGSTGLSVLQHKCNSSNEKNVTVYPEIFKNSTSACCEDEPIIHGNRAGNSLPLNIDAVPCCKTVTSYFKLEILTVRAEKQVINTIPDQIIPYPVSLDEIPAYEQPFLQCAHFQFYSPPLFGRLLVCYLHQLKIPSHLSVS